MSIACDITTEYNYHHNCQKFKIRIYDIRTEDKSAYSRHVDIPVQEIVHELNAKYGSDIGKIVIDADILKSDELVEFNGNYFKENLIYIATEKELEFDHYLKSKVQYSVGDLIIVFNTPTTTSMLCKCTEVLKENIVWKKLDSRMHKFHGQVNFQYIESIFNLKTNQVHVVFEDSQEIIEALYGSELDKYDFKSINFIKYASCQLQILSRFLLCDSDISLLLSFENFNRRKIYETFFIQDRNFIYIPKLVEDYDSKTDIMGIDLGAIRCVSAVSRNKEIQIIPLDKSSSEDLWIKSIILFEKDIPIIGKAAVDMLKTKPDHIIFDFKLFCDDYHDTKWKEPIWPFKFNLNKNGRPYVKLFNSDCSREFSLAEINKVFLDRMVEAASECQKEFNNGESVKKAVITIPRYFDNYNDPHIMISLIIKAAKLAKIEIIDIIEETYADLLYYMSNKKYSEIIKSGTRIVICDIGEGNCVCKIFEISEHKNKKYATCIGEVLQFFEKGMKLSGRDIDNILVKKLEELILESLKSKVKLRILGIAKKIKYDFSFMDSITFDLSEIDSSLKGVIEFKKQWFEENLEEYFRNNTSYFDKYIRYHSLSQTQLCFRQDQKLIEIFSPLEDISTVFLAGGTCRIPYVQAQIGKMFPKAKIVLEDKLEKITATGAAIHALQVLDKEVQPYIQLIKHSFACGIAISDDKSVVIIYDLRTKKEFDYFECNDSIQKIVNELIKEYSNNLGIIVIENCYIYELDKSKVFKKENFDSYSNLVHFATEEEMNFLFYLELKVQYLVGDLIIAFRHTSYVIYKCTEVAEKRVTWVLLDTKGYKFDKLIDFQYFEKSCHFKMNQVHVVFENIQEVIDLLYNSELDKYNFKSINFSSYEDHNSLTLSRFLSHDPEVSILVKVYDNDRSVPRNFNIQNRSYIRIPKLVKEYESRTDIMGIDLGSTRCVLAISRNRGIQVIPFDNSTPGDLWTESAVAFDREKPLIGKAAANRLKTKPDHVVFDTKILCGTGYHNENSKKSIWPFNFNIGNDQPYVRSLTCNGLRGFSLAEVSAIFLEKIKEAASEYQANFNDTESVKKAVITIPCCSESYIYSTIEAANLSNIKIIDIIEETHADLLYYLSHKKYSEMIKPGMKIGVFDIGGGTSICKVCKISEHEDKRYAIDYIGSYSPEHLSDKYSGRTIDDIIIKKLEKLIPENLRTKVKSKTWEMAKKIKHDLSTVERTE